MDAKGAHESLRSVDRAICGRLHGRFPEQWREQPKRREQMAGGDCRRRHGVRLTAQSAPSFGFCGNAQTRGPMA